FQAEDGIRDKLVTGVQTCALPISLPPAAPRGRPAARAPGPAARRGERARLHAPRGPRAARRAGLPPPPSGPAAARPARSPRLPRDRKSVVEGKRVELGRRQDHNET